MTNNRVFHRENFHLDNSSLLVNEALFHNANGYIGVRYVLEEGYPENFRSIPGQYINGFYDFLKMHQAENLYGLAKEKQTMLNIVDTQRINTVIGDEVFCMFTGTVLDSRLSVDMDKGITIRQVHWRSPGGKELKLTVKRMASFKQLCLFTIDYELEPLNFSGEIIFESLHNANVSNFVDPDDARTANIFNQYLTAVSSHISDGASYITSRTSQSDLEICSCVKNMMTKENSQEFRFNDNLAACRITTHADQNEKIRLIKYAVFCDSIRYEDCRNQAEIEMAKALSTPLETLYAKQAAYLTDYWKKCDIEIDGTRSSRLHSVIICTSCCNRSHGMLMAMSLQRA